MEKNDNIIIALIITGFTFLVFVGQWLYSDVVTFAKSGDQYQLCFSSFEKLGELLNRGILYGVDSGSSNGATDFFLRCQIPVRYLPIMIFSLIGHYSNSRMIYMAFYALHMFVAIFFALKLARNVFGLPKYIAVLFASSCMPLLCREMWYSSHAIISFLVLPLMYFSIKSLSCIQKKNWFWYSLPYVLGFTAGYVTLAVALVGCILVFAWFMVQYIKKNLV